MPSGDSAAPAAATSTARRRRLQAQRSQLRREEHTQRLFLAACHHSRPPAPATEPFATLADFTALNEKIRKLQAHVANLQEAAAPGSSFSFKPEPGSPCTPQQVRTSDTPDDRDYKDWSVVSISFATPDSAATSGYGPRRHSRAPQTAEQLQRPQATPKPKPKVVPPAEKPGWFHILRKHQDSRNPVSRRSGTSRAEVTLAEAHAVLRDTLSRLHGKTGHELAEGFKNEAYQMSDCSSFVDGGLLRANSAASSSLVNSYLRMHPLMARKAGSVSSIFDSRLGSHLFFSESASPSR